MQIPKIPVGQFFEGIVDYFIFHFSFITRGISKTVKLALNDLVKGIIWFPPEVLIPAISLLIYSIIGKRAAIITFFGMLFLWNQGLWVPTIETLVMVLLATLLAIGIGLPLGVIAGLSPVFFRVLSPLLDLMQTMPAFVYLIPTIAFFGLGSVSAIFSTIIFSLPPVIRLTSLGIREIPLDLIEVADSFGSTRMQKLLKIQLPLALPTIMAGIQQCIVLSLSMVVVAAMIGAKGLGAEVWKGIQRLDLGLGFEAGIGIVVLALVLDSWTYPLTKQKYESYAKTTTS